MDFVRRKKMKLRVSCCVHNALCLQRGKDRWKRIQEKNGGIFLSGLR